MKPTPPVTNTAFSAMLPEPLHIQPLSTAHHRKQSGYQRWTRGKKLVAVCVRAVA